MRDDLIRVILADDHSVVRAGLKAVLGAAKDMHIALADHGGGGAVATHHNSAHPLDTTIPIFMAGGAGCRGEMTPGASLLDVPATVCWALGLPLPESYAGRPLTSAFATRPLVVAA